MELLNSSKSKVATIDETTSFVRAWGKNGNVFGFYNSKRSKGEITERKLTVYKIEGLKGFYIKTDSGKEVALGTDVDAIPEILASVGITVGVVSGTASTIPESAIKAYFDADSKDKASIDVLVKINLPSDAKNAGDQTVTIDETEVTVKFKRSVNAVTVNDLINYMNSYDKIPTITSDMIIGVSGGETGSEDTMLSVKDALLEDQTVTLVWGKAVEVKYERATFTGSDIISDSSVTGTVKVPYTSTVSEAIELIKKDPKAKVAYVAPEKVDEFVGEYSKTSKKPLTKSELKKNVNSFTTDTIQVVWFDRIAKINNVYNFTSYSAENDEQLGTGTCTVSKVGEGKTTVTVNTNSVEGFSNNNYIVHSTTFVANQKYRLYDESDQDTKMYVIIG